jgi:flagellar motor component MotA
MAIAVAAIMSTTIQTRKKTAQQLREIMKKTGAKTYDEIIRELIKEKESSPSSLFGSNPRLKPFTAKEEAEFHDL